MRTLTTTMAALVATMLLAGSAHALTPADKCEADKLKRAGKYNFCRLKAESKAVKTGGTPDYSKCNSKFSDKWMSAEATGAGMCPTNGDLASMQTRITADANDVVACLNGACPDPCPPPPGQAFPATGQTTSYGPGSDGAVQAGATLAYTDNGDGTITDTNIGLMWEKKSDDGSIHDWDNTYSWGMTSPPYTMNGTMVTTFLDTLNDVGGGGASCFAGHCDWRIPNRRELDSIVNFENVSPSVSAAFNTACAPACTVLTCSCTQSNFYWSSSTCQDYPNYAWLVFFFAGYTTAYGKVDNLYVRAVRGGS